ncbi:MAG TPA: hypothetical protein PK473_03195 [Nitrosomonas sp.]|nr:hypothetical protein [Agitococcus sp.]HNA70017.1 hypothetical protein [Nitrosomonas sp.]
MNINLSKGAIIIILTFIILIALDIYLVVIDQPTLSMELKWFAKKNTWFAYLMGFLAGHWFFSTKSVLRLGWIVALSFMALLGVWDLIHYLKGWEFQWYRWAGIWFLVGIGAGTFLWGQRDGDSPI